MDLSTDTQTDLEAKERKKSNLDRSAMVGFAVVAGVGFFSTVNNIREKFDEGFVRGWGRKETPFTPIIKKYDALVDDELARYNQVKSIYPTAADKITAAGKKYQTEIIKHYQDCRKEIATQLKNELRIPTDGFRGWTEGTAKRFSQLGNKTRIAAGATAVGLGVVTWVGYAILRHTKYTLDEIDSKLDHKLREVGDHQQRVVASSQENGR